MSGAVNEIDDCAEINSKGMIRNNSPWIHVFRRNEKVKINIHEAP